MANPPPQAGDPAPTPDAGPEAGAPASIEAAGASAAAVRAAMEATLEAAAALFMEGPGNRNPHDGERLYEDPFFGFASGGDPVWETFREHFGPDFWTPAEAFRRGLAEAPVGAGGAPEASAASGPSPAGISPDELTVIAVVCPQTRATIADQRRAKGFPAKRWVASRLLHDRAVGGLNDRLAGALRAEGLEAVVPDHLPGFGTLPHERLQIISPWSHRHAAFAAGLGTFGLCDGLITKVGKAHRLGSLVVRARCEPTPRSYRGPYDWCLFHQDGRCAKCADRCPAGAITRKGHDKIRCRSFLMETTAVKIPGLWPELAGAYGCGLCQSAVPCDARRPGRPRQPAGAAGSSPAP